MMNLIRNIMNNLKWLFRKEYEPESGFAEKKGIDWIGSIPFIAFHFICFGAVWTGWSVFSIVFAICFYIVRMFAITAFYHRFISHHAFKANRFFAFVFGFLGCSAMQRGPLWWAAIHRHHHLYADTEKDIHSPLIQGFFWSHIGWILGHENRRTRVEYIKDWLKYPELIFIDKFALGVPVIMGVLIFFLGRILSIYAPQLQTDGTQLLIWGFFISTVFCSHSTFSINSIDHMFGSRRYNVPNTSRNNVLMAILTLGEGWHNNHHHYPAAARAGFYWWEIDITYYLLLMFSWFRIVKDLRPLPKNVRDENKITDNDLMPQR